MGYATSYSIKVEMVAGKRVVELRDNAPLDEVIAELREVCEEAEYALSPDGHTSDASKWYEHEVDLKVFSREHPGILFTLHGEGEENGDLWNKYFLNGEIQIAKAEVQIRPVDLDKLLQESPRTVK